MDYRAGIKCFIYVFNRCFTEIYENRFQSFFSQWATTLLSEYLSFEKTLTPPFPIYVPKAFETGFRPLSLMLFELSTQ